MEIHVKVWLISNSSAFQGFHYDFMTLTYFYP